MMGLLRALGLSLLFVISANAGERRVIIDPGHGGKDRGAIWGGVHEATLNLKVARMVEAELKRKGVPVTLTRRSDIFISLDKRAEIANLYREADFVSIHFNAYKDTRVKGCETFYAGTAGYRLAKTLHGEYRKAMKLRDRGIRRRRFVVLTKVRHAAALIECGYISNPTERRKCATPAFQAKAARAIAAGIIKHRR